MEAAQPNPRHSVVTVRPAGVPIVATGMEVRKMGMLGFVPPLRLSSNMYGSPRVGYGFVCEAVFLCNMYTCKVLCHLNWCAVAAQFDETGICVALDVDF